MTEPTPGYAIHEKVSERAEMVSGLDGLEAAALDRTKAGARHVLNVPNRPERVLHIEYAAASTLGENIELVTG